MKKRYIILFLVVLFGVIAFILVNSTPTEAPTGSVVETTAPGGSSLGPEPAPTETNSSLIKVAAPRAGDRISSPLTITGKARGNWFFEGSFPVTLTDANRVVIAEKYATADGEWMTTDFVDFTSTLNFTVPEGVTHGYLILKKDNPSDNPALDNQIELPVTF